MANSMKALVFLAVAAQLLTAVWSRNLDSHHDQANTTFNDVTEFGAVGDGVTDDTAAFKRAWKATCRSNASVKASVMHVPKGKTFLIQPVIFEGPCRSSNTTVQIDGLLVAPRGPPSWKCKHDRKCCHWILFQHVKGLFVHGSGTINGRGYSWWDRSLCKSKNIGCGKKPTALVFNHCKNVQIKQLRFYDSPQMHIALEWSTRVQISNVTIRASNRSPNTDGIHVQHSKHVSIEDSRIATGDDCISIGDGSSDLNITRINCGPGHGISIGSLGKHGKYETVQKVRVTEVLLSGTQNGVRIKTWQGGLGYARDIVFENVTLQASKRPIIIDQYYCDHENCRNQSSAVQIQNITYRNIHGTSRSETAVEIMCSQTHPCRDIFMEDINLNNRRGKKTDSVCSNVVNGIKHGSIVPEVPCLLEDNSFNNTMN